MIDDVIGVWKSEVPGPRLCEIGVLAVRVGFSHLSLLSSTTHLFLGLASRRLSLFLWVYWPAFSLSTSFNYTLLQNQVRVYESSLRIPCSWRLTLRRCRPFTSNRSKHIHAEKTVRTECTHPNSSTKEDPDLVPYVYPSFQSSTQR